MMGKTHITVGIATALAVTHPSTMQGCLAAVLGGAAGGIVCDLDTINLSKNRRCARHPRMNDAVIARIIVFVLAVIVAALDIYFHTGILNSVIALGKRNMMLLILALAALCLSAMYSKPKSFAHSIVFVFEIAVVMYFLCRPLLIPVFVGGISHLILDLLNKKPIQLFYPIKNRVCLYFLSPDKTANLVFMLVGLALDLVLLGIFMAPHLLK